MSQFRRSVVFVDANITDLSHLIRGVKPGVAVSVLTDDANGVDQITSYLSEHPADIVHIVSHGAPGVLQLGNGELSLDNLGLYASALSTWFAQAENASLLLYGCNVAAGDAGTEFIEKLHTLTGAAIGASTTKVGNAEQGGTWHFDTTLAEPVSDAPFNTETLATYSGVFPISISNLSNSSYTEQGPAYILDSDITFSGGTDYKNGYIEFSLNTATSSDFLTLATDGSPATGNGQVSIVGNAVYLGNGTTASVIGNVDATFDGQNGQKLRINLSAGFENGNFNTGTNGSTVITGWTGVNQQVKFGLDTIAGSPTPIDTTFPTNNTDQGRNTPINPGTFSTILSDVQNDGSGNSVRLTSTSITTQRGYDIVRGPYIYSNGTVQLSVGDQVSFEWQAQGGGDAYDVYGYIVEVNTGNIVTILNETGSSASAATTWATKTVNITQAGEYRFVFVAGTFDFTGGQAAGAQLYIDDVVVTQAVPPANPNDSVLSAIARKVQYSNISDTPELSKTLTVSAQNRIGETASSTATITITPVDDAPVLTTPTTSRSLDDGTSTVIAADLTLTDVDGGNLNGARVSIGSGFKAGQDALGISGQSGTSGTVDGLAWTFDSGTGILTLSGSGSAATYQSALRKVTFNSLSNAPATAGARDIQIALGSQLANPDNGHFYEFVTAPGIDWTEARDAAAARSLFGLKGYLATITSATENTFVASKLQGQGWMGASDAGTEGNWQWVTGPEAGTQFWSGNFSGGPVSSRYDNWANGEPNDAGGEDYAHFLEGSAGEWNDYGNTTFVDGYVVEYGGSAGDPILSIIKNVTVTVNSVNDAPTGTVTISGTPTQGQTLTASNDLADADGLGPITYTWFSGGVSTGSTGSTYVLKQSDVGKVMTVQASYTDGGSKTETVTSTGTSAVANTVNAPTGSVTITGDATQGGTLTATNDLADADGVGAITYTWFVDGVDTGKTGATYTLGQSDVGKVITVRASYTDGDGKAESVTSSGTSAVANTVNAPTGSVTITGTATQGGTLTATNDLADADGVGAVTYTWFVDGVDTGKTGATYTLGQSDVGKVVTVRASYTDGDGKTESVTSSGTSTVAEANIAPSGTVTISGTATQGGTLTATNDLTDADGLGAVTYTWFVDGVDTGKTGATYTLGQSDVGKVVTVRASYTDGDGKAESVTSGGTSAVANTVNAPTGSVTITGDATQGGTLTATNDLEDADGVGAITYTWLVDGIDTGKTGATYTLGQSDVGKVVTVRASYTDGDGKTESVTSGGSSTVADASIAPTGTVTITGDATQGGTLTATNDLEDADGLGAITYTWFVDGVDTGKTGATYDLGQSDVGKVITVRASYTDGDGKTESVTSGGSSAVANTSNDPRGGVTIDGTATQGATLTATNTLEDPDGLGELSYQWEQSLDGTTWETISGATASTFTPTQEQVNQFVRAKVSYTDGDGTAESVTSTATTTKVTNVNDAPTGSVTVNGSVRQGCTLTANTSALVDDDGLPSTLSYQWQASSDQTTWTDISGATAATFSPTQAQANQFVRVQVSYIDGQGTPEQVLSQPASPPKPTSDFTGDGQADILWRNATLGSTVVWEMDGPEVQMGHYISPDVDGSWRVEAIADFDGNGSPDLLWQNAFTGEPVLWLFDGLTLASGVELPEPGAFWEAVGAADFNCDNQADILWHNSITGNVELWLMDGTQPVEAVSLLTVPEPWDVEAVGDFSRDGRADILWRNSLSGESVVWLMEGEEVVGAATLPTVPVNWELHGAADFTGDTHLDLLWHNQTTGEVVIWEMQGLTPQNAISLPSVDPSWEAVL